VVILNLVCGFPQSVQANAKLVPRLGHSYFLPHFNNSSLTSHRTIHVIYPEMLCHHLYVNQKVQVCLRSECLLL